MHNNKRFQYLALSNLYNGRNYIIKKKFGKYLCIVFVTIKSNQGVTTGMYICATKGLYNKCLLNGKSLLLNVFCCQQICFLILILCYSHLFRTPLTVLYQTSRGPCVARVILKPIKEITILSLKFVSSDPPCEKSYSTFHYNSNLMDTVH